MPGSASIWARQAATARRATSAVSRGFEGVVAAVRGLRQRLGKRRDELGVGRVVSAFALAEQVVEPRARVRTADVRAQAGVGQAHAGLADDARSPTRIGDGLAPHVALAVDLVGPERVVAPPRRRRLVVRRAEARPREARRPTVPRIPRARVAREVRIGIVAGSVDAVARVTPRGRVVAELPRRSGGIRAESRIRRGRKRA